MAWVSHTSLRLWVGLLERWFAKADSDDDAPPRETRESRLWSDIFDFSRTTVCWNPKVPYRFDMLDGNVPIHTLGLQHDTDRLEHATELLPLNIQAYRCHGEIVENIPGSWKEKPPWAELREEARGEIEARRQHAKREWAKTKNLVNADHHWSLYRILCALMDNNVASVVFREQALKLAIKRTAEQMFWLLVAVRIIDHSYGHIEGEDGAALEEWCAQLLRKCLCRIAPTVQAAERKSLVELRQLLRLACAKLQLVDEFLEGLKPAAKADGHT